MREKIEEFLSQKSKEIQQLAEKYPDKKSLVIDYSEFHSFDHQLAEELVKKPDEIIKLFEEILSEQNIPVAVDLSEKPKFYVRFMNLPKEKGYTVMVRNITSDYIGKFISVEGVVNKIGDVLPKVYNAIFYCNRCDERVLVLQDKRILQEPYKCPGCQRSEFRFSPDESEWIDIQRLEIQEPLEMLKGGEQARKIEVWAEEDMTDVVTAGDKIVVTGIVRLKPPEKRGVSVFYKFIEANYVEGIEREFEEIDITEEEEKEIKKLAKDPKIYDKIIKSIAPSIYGYDEVKEAIALQLFGGRPGKKLPDGTSVRPDIHILLIGDPGVAKSKMLQYVDNIAPKSIYVSGASTTGAGLTATAEKDELAEGAWTLKAGALVLAGGGIAAIDEFDKMSKEDRGAMHEAMEQQTISVAKAGIITKFKANTSILAASNPKFSRFDRYKSPAEQFDIPPTLMSRFDLMFPIKDVVDRELDKNIAEHMLKMHGSGEDLEDIKPDIPADLFRKYIAYSRIHVRPMITEDAKEKLMDYYVNLRASSHGGAVPATPRQLEALVRLSEASAKIRLSDTVTVTDAERAIRLTNFVLREVAYDESTGVFDIDRIVTEHPKSTRDKIRVVESIIRELVGEDESATASLENIKEKAREHDIDGFETEKLIEELKLKGYIFEPRHGQYGITIE